MTIHQLALSTADLSDTDLRRDFLSDPAEQEEVYVQTYDRTTLWYDAFWRRGRVFLICPKLMNFAPLISAAQFKLDGQPRKIFRLRQSSRHDIIELKSRRCPAEISAAGEGFEVATPVTRAELDRFAGMNAHFTMSLDNDPEWIRDFALFHRRTQGLQAMVLFDNGSTRYPLSVIEDVLQDVGLSDFAIVSVPLPYGRSTAQKCNRAKFLHTGLMNVARLRFLGHARAVLNADIDELVWTECATVFDKVANSFLGFATYAGERRYPAKGLERPVMHNDHDHICNKVKSGPLKYCIAPRGPLGRLSWDVHKLIGLPFNKKRFLRFDIGYLHCHRINTDWKDKPQPRRLPPARLAWLNLELHHDPHTRDLLDRAFSEQHAR